MSLSYATMVWLIAVRLEFQNGTDMTSSLCNMNIKATYNTFYATLETSVFTGFLILASDIPATNVWLGEWNAGEEGIFCSITTITEGYSKASNTWKCS